MANTIEYPVNPSIGDEFTVGGTRKRWDGTKWKNVSFGNHEVRIDKNFRATEALLKSLGLSGNFGFFNKGFTYTEAGDVGIDENEQFWLYNGSLPFEVVKGTVPSEPDYSEFRKLNIGRENKHYKYGDIIKIESMFYDHTLTTKTPFLLSEGESLLDKIESGHLDAISNRSLRPFSYPQDWDGPEPLITYSGNGSYSIVGWSEALFRNNNMVKPYGSRNKTYYVTMDGDDTNGGLSESDSLRSVNAALSKPDCLTIMLKGGGYYSMTTVTSYSVNIMAYSGKAIIFSIRVPNSVLVQTNVYSFTDTVPHGVPVSAVLKDEFGTPIPYTQVDSITEVSQTPLSFFNDGNVCYVHASSPPVNGEDIFVSPKNFGNSLVSNTNDNSGNQLYLEKLIFPNSIRAISNLSYPLLKIYALDVTGAVNLKGGIDNAWEVTYCDTYLNRCNASYSRNDGFNYELGEHIEYKCVARGNYDDSGSNQASTTHNISPMLRVDCDFETSNQNVVLDVDDSITINIGVRASSESVQPSVSFSTATGRTMYCYDCIPSTRSGLTDGHYRNDNTGGNKIIIDGIIGSIQVRNCLLSGE